MCFNRTLSKEEIAENRKFLENSVKKTLYAQYPFHKDHQLVKIGSFSRNFILGVAVECDCGELLVIARHAIETAIGFRDDKPFHEYMCPLPSF